MLGDGFYWWAVLKNTDFQLNKLAELMESALWPAK